MNHRSGLTLASGALLAILAFSVVVVAMLMTITGQSADDRAPACPPGDAVPVANTVADSNEGPGAGAQVRLSSVQAANAQAIVAEGYKLDVPREVIVIALAVARQESNFTNYANDGKGHDLALFQYGIEASLDLPHEGVGSDHGSLGVFQQQWPWWGTMKDLMTPATAAAKFFKALLAVPGWQSMTPTEAGQAVQHSAYPDAYADDVPFAEQLLAHLRPAAQTSCAVGAVAVGTVVEPLAPGVGFTDLHNFGDHGSHWTRGHTGTDLSAPCGSPVVAATNGTVEIRTDQSWAGPWLVEVSTGPGHLTTWYAHMRAIDVQPGDQVAAGQQLGEVGDLGNATGCHLHFEVHPHGGDMYADEVDPSTWLGSRDRSWGIRPVGEAEPPGAPTDPPFEGMWWLYVPLQFEDFAVVLIIQEDPSGFRTLNDCTRAWKDGRVEQLGWPLIDVHYASGTRTPTGATIRCTTPEGKALVLEVESRLAVPLHVGGGYGGDPDWIHGAWKGADFAERVTYAMDDPAVQGRFMFGCIDHVGRATADGAEGFGLFEHFCIGRHDPSGFADFFSLAP